MLSQLFSNCVFVYFSIFSQLFFYLNYINPYHAMCNYKAFSFIAQNKHIFECPCFHVPQIFNCSPLEFIPDNIKHAKLSCLANR